MPGTLVGAEEGIDAGPQGGIAGAGLAQIGGPLGEIGQGHGSGKHGLGAVGGLAHGWDLRRLLLHYKRRFGPGRLSIAAGILLIFRRGRR
jgi:hypothetical protein